MSSFYDYLLAAQKAVQEKYNIPVTFYWGEYTPDITNFHYNYVFASENNGYKVIVNTFSGGEYCKFLIWSWPTTFKARLTPISLPMDLTLEEAYKLAVARGFFPNLSDGVAFLENNTSSDLGPGYWFLNEKNEAEWIFVSALGTHPVMLTDKQPITV